MGYCAVEDVQTDFKKIDFSSAGAVVSSDMVEDWIDQESELINSYICNRYKVPVSDVKSPASYMILKRIAIFLVSERVKNKIEVKTGISQKDSEEKSPNYSRTPLSDLKSISDGKIHLRDAELLSSAVGSFNIDSCDQPVFDVTKQQW